MYNLDPENLNSGETSQNIYLKKTVKVNEACRNYNYADSLSVKIDFPYCTNNKLIRALLAPVSEIRLNF